MRKLLFLILSTVFVLSGGESWAQERTVSGRVTSAEDGQPLPGVSVFVKGTNAGAPTDADGAFSILVPSDNSVLVFTFIGMKTVEVPVGSKSQIDVIMQEDVSQLSEVVVVAYGEQTRRQIVGSVASVGSDLIGKQQIASVATAIQGTVPGVNIIQAGGQPGDNPTIRIRGIGSINASAEPLIILNGVQFNGNINTISADQIETINVLKDASATALYGSRAANGVLLITTKKGKLNQPAQFSFNASVGLANQAVKMHDFVDTDTYTRYSWEAVKNAHQYVNGETAADAAQLATDELITGWLQYNPYGIPKPVNTDGTLVTTDKLWDTDWKKHIQNTNAVRHDYSMSVSGGSDKTTFFLSANYLNQEGSVQTSDFKRFTTRLNLDSKLNNWFSVGLNTAFSTQSQNYPDQAGTSYQSAIAWLYNVPSYYPLYRHDEAGNLVLDNFGKPIYDYGNTVGQLLNGARPTLAGENAVGALYNYDVENDRNNFSGTGYAQVDFTDYLSFRTIVGYENYLLDAFNYAHNEFGYAANVKGRVTNQRDITTGLTNTNVLNFNKSFGDHNVDISAIQESIQTKISSLAAQGTGFLPNVKVLNGSTTPESVSGAISETRLTSYLGRASYNFKEKYFIEGSLRRDASSRFNEDVRNGTFYSIGTAWVVSDESFLDNLNAVNFLKLKASYGVLGNNALDGYFPYLSNFQTGWNQGPFTGVLVTDINDYNLDWEKTAQFNVGIETRFLNDRIGVNVEYYNKESVDLVYDRPIPNSTGFSNITDNVGSLKNYGIEVTITSTNIRNANVTWTSGLNFSRDRNEILELEGGNFISGTKRWEVGRSLYDFWIQEWAGVNPDNGYGMWYKDVLDANGDPTGEHETTETYSEATRYYVGKSSLPDFIGGFTNYLRVGNFDMNILMNFSFGGYIYDSQYAALMGSLETPGGNSASPDLAKRWTKPGDVTDVPLLLADNNDFNAQSTRFLFRNDYVRLRALNIGYNLPKSLTDRAQLSNMRVFFQGDNLLTFASHKGLDPEQSLAGTTNNRSFNQRIVSLGLNLTF
jgi:TonB-linked SusC/RagA family outer membrane protein